METIIQDSIAFYNGWNWTNYTAQTSSVPGGLAGARDAHIHAMLEADIDVQPFTPWDISYFGVYAAVIPVSTYSRIPANRIRLVASYRRGFISAVYSRK